MVWSADVDWLEREGVDPATFMHPSHTPKRLALPPNAEDVTGRFNVRCRRCFELLNVFAIVRARVAAGVGLVTVVPSRGGEAPPPRQPGAAAPPATRLTSHDGRRARRIVGEPQARSQATVTFDFTVVDLSILGLSAEHTHEVQPGNLYTLFLRLMNQPAPLRITARAVWTTSSRIEEKRGARQTTFRSGFEFVNLDMQTAAALDIYIRGRLEREVPRRG